MQTVDAEILRRYPEPAARPVREFIASTYGLNPENVIATNGGDELLRLAVTTFVPQGGVLGLPGLRAGFHGFDLAGGEH
jgi:histidinol-phosphate aminotransferase